MVNYNENAIREAAYYIWQKAGCPNGKDQEFWSLAVEQLNGKTSSKSTAKKSTSSSSKKTTSASCKTSSAKKTSSSKKSK